MKWLRDQLQLFENTKDTQGMAESVENTNGVYIVPAFVGLGAPYWDDACQATIVGLTFGANKNHIVRSSLGIYGLSVKRCVRGNGSKTAKLRFHR